MLTTAVQPFTILIPFHTNWRTNTCYDGVEDEGVSRLIRLSMIMYGDCWHVMMLLMMLIVLSFGISIGRINNRIVWFIGNMDYLLLRRVFQSMLDCLLVHEADDMDVIPTWLSPPLPLV